MSFIMLILPHMLNRPLVVVVSAAVVVSLKAIFPFYSINTLSPLDEFVNRARCFYDYRQEFSPAEALRPDPVFHTKHIRPHVHHQGNLPPAAHGKDGTAALPAGKCPAH